MSPQELAKAADLRVTTRVSRKAQGGRPQGVVSGGPQKKEGGDKHRREFSLSPQSSFPKKDNPANTGPREDGVPDRKPWQHPLTCYEY